MTEENEAYPPFDTAAAVSRVLTSHSESSDLVDDTDADSDFVHDSDLTSSSESTESEIPNKKHKRQSNKN